MSVTDTATPRDVLDSGDAGGKAIRGGAYRTVAYGISLLMSLAAVPLMIRHLGPVDFGYFMTVSSIVFIIGGITEAGLTNLGVRDYSVLEGDRREAFLRNLVGLRLALTLAGVLAAIALTTVTGAPEVVVLGTAIAGLGLLLTLLQQTYMVPLTAGLRLGWVSVLDLLKQGTLTGAVVVLVLAGAGLLPFFAANVAAALLMLAATLALVRREAPFMPALDVRIWKDLLRDVLPYALAAAVGLVYFRLAMILMFYIGSETETGIYGAAFRIVEVIAVIPWLVVSSGFPILARAARDDEDRLRYALQRLFEVSALVGGGICVAIAVGAPFAIAVVAGDEFEASIGVLQLLGGALVTSFLVATWSFALLSLRLHKELLIANAVAAAVAAAGTLALVPSEGAMGAAVATLVAEAVLAAAYYVALVRARAALRPSLWIVPRLLVAGAAAGAAATVVPGPSWALMVLAGAVYLGAAFALRAVPPELAAALLRRPMGGAPPGSVSSP